MSERTISILTYIYLIVSSYFIIQQKDYLLYFAANLILACILSDFLRQHTKNSKKAEEKYTKTPH